MEYANVSTHNQEMILIKRAFHLPLETVWKAWSDEESLKRWWGPKNFTCPYCKIDFREGGKILACMKSGEDGKETWSTGVYKEIRPMEKIVMTDSFSDSQGNVIAANDIGMPGSWPLECMVTLTFETLDTITYLTLKHVGIPEEMQEDCIKGWEECFDKLEFNFKTY